jgi:SM-20-related protein
MTSITLNPTLDVDALARKLAKEGRLQVKDVFEPESADLIHHMLVEQTPWWLVFNEGDRAIQISHDRLVNLHPQQVEQIFAGVVDRAQREYQYIYAFYPIIGTYFDPKAPKVPLLDLFEFLNSRPMLEWFRRLTGRDDIQWVDAQGTLYQSGHFLKSHSDRDEANVRVAAYVLNFTRYWERDWGGYLQFFTENHDIDLALRPIFNAMNIFLVPADHSVGLVSPFAPEDRLAVTGWLRTDLPPGPIGRD